MEKKNVVIYVAGQRFSITTLDTPEYVMGIGEKIDVMIKGIQKDNPKLNRDACAILTALNICDDETKLRQMLEVLREQVKDYLDQNEKLRTENDELKAQVKALKEKAPEKTVSAHAEKKAEPAPVPVAKKGESAVAAAVQRQTAFVGKNFSTQPRKDHKPVAPVAPAVSSAPAEDTDTDDNSPYHQFSIFDDLI